MTLREWLVADGLGGYAMGTNDGIRTRRYHGLLLVAASGTERRFMLVNGVEAWIDHAGTSVPLISHKYHPDAEHPKRIVRTSKYSTTPWPEWTLEWPGGAVAHSILGVHGNAATVLRWTWQGEGSATLRVRLQHSGRDWHALQHENAAFRFDSEPASNGARHFSPYDGVPPVVVHATGSYRHAPLWFLNFQYDEEKARGQDFLEDLASPGEFTFELSPSQREAVIVLTTSPEWGGLEIAGDVRSSADALLSRERTRIEAFATPMERLGDQFIVTRGKRRTIIAGYPWFTDWGRDTFIALRGLCLATGRRADAEAILLSWCEHLSQGMMPNLFPSGGTKPEYNSVDAALWFVIAVSDLTEGPVRNVPLPFIQAIEEILTHYSRGTRHGIRVDKDGLLAAGEPGIALTWMDAVVDGKPVTPRIGKPVEVQALWVNALEFASTWNKRWATVAARARDSFTARFWNEKRQCLYDVVDVDHVAGTSDERLRPNQIFACGGLAHRLVAGDRARAICKLVGEELHTRGGGLRTLGPRERGYVGRVDGPLRQRDLGYHQGTAWPWLMGAWHDAIGRLKHDVDANAAVSVPDHVGPSTGMHPSFEIADGDSPHTARGCPFQAWTVGEAIRMMAR